jgi:serine/threonine protein kinase
MYAGHPPFSSATHSDWHYHRLVKNPAQFWKSVNKRHPEGFLSDDFKNLIENMLHEEPQRRFNLADIASHDFMISN